MIWSFKNILNFGLSKFKFKFFKKKLLTFLIEKLKVFVIFHRTSLSITQR